MAPRKARLAGIAPELGALPLEGMVPLRPPSHLPGLLHQPQRVDALPFLIIVISATDIQKEVSDRQEAQATAPRLVSLPC